MGGNAARRKKDARRQSKIAAQIQLPTGPDGTWQPPAPEECDVETFTVEPSEGYRISSRVLAYENRMVHYAVVASYRPSPGDDWQEVACVDCAHSAVHMHTGPNHVRVRNDIRPIRSQRDVEDTYDDAYDTVYDAYVAHRDRE